jgi:hypothetical protein
LKPISAKLNRLSLGAKLLLTYRLVLNLLPRTHRDARIRALTTADLEVEVGKAGPALRPRPQAVLTANIWNPHARCDWTLAPFQLSFPAISVQTHLYDLRPRPNLA